MMNPKVLARLAQRDKKMTTVTCCHCGVLMHIAVENLRVPNYCEKCK